MKTIEGHFGSAVGTYFKFLRWLFSMNLFLVFLTFGFIIIPQILFSTVQTNVEEEKSLNMTVVEPKIYDERNSFQFIDILTAEVSLAKLDSKLFNSYKHFF